MRNYNCKEMPKPHTPPYEMVNNSTWYSYSEEHHRTFTEVIWSKYLEDGNKVIPQNEMFDQALNPVYFLLSIDICLLNNYLIVLISASYIHNSKQEFKCRSLLNHNFFDYFSSLSLPRSNQCFISEILIQTFNLHEIEIKFT